LTPYGLEDQGIRIRFPAQAKHYSFFINVQTGSETYRISYPVGTFGYFPGDEAAGA
jgi:hypothetical protein